MSLYSCSLNVLLSSKKSCVLRTLALRTVSNIPRLSHGTHTITAKVKDSKGKESSKTVTVSSFKASRLELSVSTKRIFSLRQVKVSWKGGSSGVDIAMDGVKVDSGPNQGSRYYWSRKKTRIKVSDSLNPSVSVTRTTK